MKIETISEDGLINLPKVTRVEVIGSGGREYNKWGNSIISAEISVQDDGRTLKVFLKERKKVKITKLEDNAFNSDHPNGINVGYVKQGLEISAPKIGERYYIDTNFSTSPITEIIDDSTFKSTYSTYKIEYLYD